MEYYVGLDVSLKQTSICVVNQTGSIVQEGVVDSDPESIASFVGSKAPGTVRIGIETGPTTTWLWTELNRLGKAWGAKLTKRNGLRKAKVAVARKLAVILHRMWIDGTEFNWSMKKAVS